MAAAILDIDGTLVDTNYHHAIAWYRAFRAARLRAAAVAHPPAHRDGRRPAGRRPRRRGVRRASRATTSARPRRCSTWQLIDEVAAARGRARADRGPQGRRPRGRARLLGQAGRARALPRPARRARARRRLDDVRRRRADQARARPRRSPRWRRRAAEDAVMVGDSTWDCRGRQARRRALGRRPDRRLQRDGAARRGRRRASFAVARELCAAIWTTTPAGLNVA